MSGRPQKCGFFKVLYLDISNHVNSRVMVRLI